jgi:bis(5'-nucleosidyl)-tetraphosphatase
MERQETSVGAVVISSNSQFLLILQRKADYWEFPKGHMEGQEDELVTMDREVKEEIGIKHYELIKGFRHETHYSFNDDGCIINKTAVFYLIRVNEPITISIEHKEYRWVNYKEALKLVKYNTQKATLTKASSFMKNELL